MLDDEYEAIRALKQGDIAGLHALVMLHQHCALRTAYRIVGDTQLAQDIVSDVFLVVYDQPEEPEVTVRHTAPGPAESM